MARVEFVKSTVTGALGLSCTLWAAPVLAQDVNPDNVLEPPRIYSPYVERTAADANFAEGVFWGDTHLHTNYSTDSSMLGNTLGPEEAYRFARGEEVRSAAGMRTRLIRPLDFLVVADHAENLGLAPMIAESNSELLKNEWGRMVHDMVKAGDGRGAFQQWLADAVTVGQDPIDNPRMTRTVWDRQIAFAEQYNEPGRFTALIGFEWSSIATQETPGNLHRVVIFKDGGEKVGQVLPFSSVHSNDPERLWDYLAAYEEATGGRVLAIAHNGNVSNGQMFSLETLSGQPIDRAYAETRMRWEPLYEVTQMKGDGETHPFLSPNDEFADYGTWDKGTIFPDGRTRTPVGNTVDEADASYLNNIGDAELRAVWTDPDFDPGQRAFYYARVLEIPTPTWQAYDSKFFNIRMPDDVPLSHQERAYTSPIWYTPGM